MERTVQTIKSVTKGESISAVPLKCPTCSGKLEFIDGDLYKCLYCGTLSRFADGKFENGTKKSTVDDIKAKPIESATNPTIEELNDGTRKTQTVVSVDKRKKRKAIVGTMFLTDFGIIVEYIDKFGHENSLSKGLICLLIMIGANMAILAAALYGDKIFRAKKENSDNQTTTNEEVVKRNGGMRA